MQVQETLLSLEERWKEFSLPSLDWHPFSPKTVFLASKPYIWTVGSFQVFCAVNTDSGLGKTPLHTFWITLHGHSWGRVSWGSSIATAYAPQGIISAKLWFIRRTVETCSPSKMVRCSNSSHWCPAERPWELRCWRRSCTSMQTSYESLPRWYALFVAFRINQNH